MTDKIEKMTDDDFKKVMQSLGMPENMSLYSALKQVENHTWQAARTVPEGWGIDTSTGRRILVYKDCSVIEDEQADFIMHLLSAAPEGK